MVPIVLFRASLRLATDLPLFSNCRFVISPALMLPPLAEATCVSDNTFTLADELATSIDERGVDPANPGARRAKRHLLKDDNGPHAAGSLPTTGNITLHDRRSVLIVHSCFEHL